MKVAEAVLQAAPKKDPNAKMLVGRRARQVRALRTLLPRALFELWSSSTIRPGQSHEVGTLRLSSEFISEVLLCFGEIKLMDQEKLVPTALPKLADQKRV